MTDEIKKLTELEFFFEHDPNYRIIAANGIWGGLTPRGDIQLDFFVEKQNTPESIRHELKETGVLGDELGRFPSRKIIRRLQVGILLSAEQADSVANFIKDKVKELREIREKIK